LFTGDFKRIEPHLGLVTSGCARLDYTGPELAVSFEPELRRPGKPNKSLGSSTSRFRGPGEASFSVREMTDPNGKRKYRLVCALVGCDGLGASHGFDGIDPPETGELGLSGGTATLSDPQELVAGELIPVWAYVLRADGRWEGRRTIDETVATGQWALVVMFKWRPVKDWEAGKI
jgi:hypothetical protein